MIPFGPNQNCGDIHSTIKDNGSLFWTSHHFTQNPEDRLVIMGPWNKAENQQVIKKYGMLSTCRNKEIQSSTFVKLLAPERETMLRMALQ